MILFTVYDPSDGTVIMWGSSNRVENIAPSVPVGQRAVVGAYIPFDQKVDILQFRPDIDGTAPDYSEAQGN